MRVLRGQWKIANYFSKINSCSQETFLFVTLPSRLAGTKLHLPGRGCDGVGSHLERNSATLDSLDTLHKFCELENRKLVQVKSIHIL